MAAAVKPAAAYWRAEVVVMPRRIGGGAGRTVGAGWELAEPRRVRAASAFAQGRPSLLRGAARVPLRLLRCSGRHDGRQAAARVLDPGAVRARVRLRRLEHAPEAAAHEVVEQADGGDAHERLPAFTAGLALALTPVSVAIWRH